MKKLLIIMVLALASLGLRAQNDAADNIVGVFFANDEGDNFKIRITKEPSGTYKGQIIWVEKKYDKNGNVMLDTKNPDKSLRNVPCDKIVIFKGLKYNAEKERWDGTKIYHPKMGIKANMTAKFTDATHLTMTGSLMGITQSRYFVREE